MKQIYLCTLVIILSILQSCTFEPKGEEYVTIDPAGKTPDIQINLNLAADTLYIPTNTETTFAYGLNNEKVNWAQFNVNGAQSDVIKIQPNMVSLVRSFKENAGVTYSLEMKIFAKSQTGSIADRIGAEGFMISRKWTIIIVNISQLASRITKADFVDGTIKIEWEKYIGAEFINYKIYKLLRYFQQYKFLVATINSRGQTSYIDSTYCGEESQYYVVTNDNYQGSVYTVQGPIPILTAENNANGDILLKWSKPPYYKNLKGYRISCPDKSLQVQSFAEVANGTSESFIVPNPLFAHNYDFYLTPLGKTDNYYNQSYSISYLSTLAKANYGITVPKFKDAVSEQGPLTYFLNSTEGIFLFDQLKNTTTRQIKYNDVINYFAVSSNDQYLVTMVGTPHKIHLEDLSDPAKSKIIDISASFPLMGSLISISNEGTGIMTDNTIGILYDYLNERKLSEFNLSGKWIYSNKISASGNFFYIKTYSSSEYYQYKNNRLALLELGTNQGDDLVLNAEYLPGNNEKLVRAYHNRIEVVDCNTWTVEKKWLFPNQITSIYNLDIKNGKLLICIKSKLILFDVLKGTQEEIATIDDLAWTIEHFFYYDGFLYWGEGKAIKKN